MLLDTPLSAADLRELRALLRSRATAGERMDIETLHGFITALVVGPDVVMPGEWLPYVWHGNEPEWETMDQAEHAMSLILRMNNDVSRACFDGAFEPLLRNAGGRNAWTREATRWAGGFLAGVELRRETWQPFMRSEAAEMIMPVIVLQAPSDDPEAADLVDTPAKRRRMIDQLADSVLAMHAYWLERRQPTQAPEMGKVLPFRKPATPGRNDPCPCGSGKKYKRCCGAT